MIGRLFIFIVNIASVCAKDIYVGSYGAYVNGESDVNSALANGIAFNNAVKDAEPTDSIIMRKNETMYYIPNTDDNTDPYFDNLNKKTGHFPTPTMLLHQLNKKFYKTKNRILELRIV